MEKQGRKDESAWVYQQALAADGLSPKAKEYIKTRLQALQGPGSAVK